MARKSVVRTENTICFYNFLDKKVVIAKDGIRIATMFDRAVEDFRAWIWCPINPVSYPCGAQLVPISRRPGRHIVRRYHLQASVFARCWSPNKNLTAIRRPTICSSKLQNTSNTLSDSWLPACGHRGGSGKSKKTGPARTQTEIHT